MRDTTYGFCEVCKLQGSKRMSQLIDGKSLYVAEPEVKKYTGQYSKPSDFADTTYNGYYYFENYRKGVLLSGWDKNKFNTGMVGEKIQLRTIVQNLSDTTQRYVTMKMWIKRADGSVATTRSGDKLETSQTFTIPVWSEKSKFWPKGALSYEGSNMNSGLENCELIYQIPSDAVLNSGDTVAFEVTDENGNILANDNTETQTYANINIEYKFEDGTPMPNTNKATIPVAVGSQLNWTAPAELFGHTFVRAEGHDQIVNGSGQTVTYYYSKQSNVHIHDWGEWVTNGNGTHTRTCRTDNSHKETENCVGGNATCTHKPVCDVCHGEYGQAKSHDWGEWRTNGNGTHTRTCRTDSSHSETANCVGGSATCTHKAVCDVCHGEYGQPKSHDWGEWKTNGNGTHTRTCMTDSAHSETANCVGGNATCTHKAVCDVCHGEYGQPKPHTTTKYGGKDHTGHWDTCKTCNNKFNIEQHTPDRAKPDDNNPVKCTKCGYIITPAGHYEHTASGEWHNSADGNITITNAKTAVVVRFWTKSITRVAVQLATRERYVRFADLNTATNLVTAGER